MPWTIDLLIDYCSYIRVAMLSIYWNCPGKWCQRLSSNWNCLNNRFRRLSIIWIYSYNWLRGLSINWNCLYNWFLVLSNNWNCLVKLFRRLSINWNNSDFRDRPLTGIDWTIDVWCFQLIGTVQTNDLGPRPSIGIVLAIVFTGCLLNGCLLYTSPSPRD